jgi:hypothetical protein
VIYQHRIAQQVGAAGRREVIGVTYEGRGAANRRRIAWNSPWKFTNRHPDAGKHLMCGTGDSSTTSDTATGM